ncbi:hypothetical protein SAMN04487904_113118 [Actinopolyspora lacussalsi subsp. righensis]|uniref:Uncharacterized protein n=1 Tax=Actinopolyspora righensis TaxID=995060 RepID=A0A1I7BZS0_9ACTN|nr:hypothetical protein [Actinopolyspora righensis]SFT92660.1 hypothetical protein SAMN04487904_113118 [Actinopolyspora righensis]
MPLYIAKHSLKKAVDRLGTSAASANLGDYLIFKRALQNRIAEARYSAQPAPETVVTGTRSSHYTTAINEFALWVIDIPPSDVDNPYFIPFGSTRDKTRGYRSAKFPSNGSSDTVSRWQQRSRAPLLSVPNTKPKEYYFANPKAHDLESFFMPSASSDSSENKPQILDSAIWWFRSTDLYTIFDHNPTDEEVTNKFIDDTGLNDNEIRALFSSDTPLVHLGYDPS